MTEQALRKMIAAGEWEVRQRGADVGGKLVVIGSKLDEHAIATLFGC